MKKVLVIGGTGAMGVYVVPELVNLGYEVHVPSLEDVEQSGDNPKYFKADMKNIDTLKKVLAEKYDAIIDYLVYPGDEFKERYKLFLDSTDHYIYLSSYRIYAGDCPINEESARLLDVATDKKFLDLWEREYSLYKAVGEDILRNSGYKNWSIVRPAITYSKRRFQLVTHEAYIVVNRALDGKKIVLPEQARNVRGTMSWAGDVAKMFTGILLNERAYGESFTFATAENHTWGEIADIYKELTGVECVWVDKQDYCDLIGAGNPHVQWQLEYDRLFDRVIDNSKILDVAGLKQEDFMPLKEGLKLELAGLPEGFRFEDRLGTNDRMDEYLKKHGL